MLESICYYNILIRFQFEYYKKNLNSTFKKYFRLNITFLNNE
jgi:hypothetical protein